MGPEDAGLRRERRRWWLGVAALAAGTLSIGGTVVVSASAITASHHLSPSVRADLWIAELIGRTFPFIAICALLGIILGVAAGRKAGFGICALLIALLGASLGPVFIRKPESHLKTQCLANVKLLATAVQMYAEDYERFPPSATWSDQLNDYIKQRDAFRCPDATGTCAYAYNAALGNCYALP